MLNTSDGQSSNSRIEPDTLAFDEKLRDPLVPFQTVVLHSSVHGEAHSAIHSDDTLCLVPNDCHSGADVLCRSHSQSARTDNWNSILPNSCSIIHPRRLHYRPWLNCHRCSSEHTIPVCFPDKRPIWEDLDLQHSDRKHHSDRDLVQQIDNLSQSELPW